MKKLTALILLIALLSCVLPFNSVAADSAKIYLSLGDSIAAGYGLKNKSNDSYPNLLAKNLSHELRDFAVDGADSADLLKQLSNPDKNLSSALQAASVITVNIGLNNFANAFEDLSPDIDTESMGDYPQQQIDPKLISAYISEYFKPGVKEYDDMIKALNKACEKFKSDIDKIAGILAKNKTAKIVFLTVYNPYKDYEKIIKPIYDTAETYINKINNIIKETCASNKFIIADVQPAVKKSTKKVLNASVLTFNTDPHPNVAGHKLIYKTVANSLGKSIYFSDINNDAQTAKYADDLHEAGIMFAVAASANNAQKKEFSPKAEVNNSDFAVFMVRTLKLKIKDSDVSGVKLPFSDIDKIPNYALNSVKACYKAGLYNKLYPGADGRTYAFGPQKSVSRTNAASITSKYIDKSKWLDNNLNASGGITRAETAKILWLILN
ncbi:MAG: SGNH/GDSL hydrolase family protein [Oscillospiraceae bacterium]|nr:SGNH/GDSL hydrolase family protein [Oscillospiraceae bacterium]